MNARISEPLSRAAERASAVATARYVGVADGDVCVHEIAPTIGAVSEPAIVFVPGWASTPRTWRYAITALARAHRIFYIETREKASARLRADRRQDIDRAAGDIVDVCDGIPGPFVLVGASTGANLVALASSRLGDGCVAVVLMAPHRGVPIPRWLGMFEFVPRRASSLAQRAAVVVGRLRKPRGYEQTQYDGLVASAAAADLTRLGASARAWNRHTLDDGTLALVNHRALVVASSSDSFHAADAARSIAAAIKGADLIEVRNFAALHAANTARAIVNWVDAGTRLSVSSGGQR